MAPKTKTECSRSLTVILTMTVVLLACTMNSDAGNQPVATTAASCTKSTVTSLINDFFNRWNSGQPTALRALLAPNFSVDDGIDGRRNVLTTNEELATYLAARRASHDRFEDLQATVPANPHPETANATVAFKRTADGRLYTGGAKIICVADHISGVVMSSE